MSNKQIKIFVRTFRISIKRIYYVLVYYKNIINNSELCKIEFANSYIQML